MKNKYNFDELSNRKNTHSEKWNVKENELPMWVADMDFLVLPEIRQAIVDAAYVGTYGYVYPTDKFFKARNGALALCGIAQTAGKIKRLAKGSV